MDLNKEMDIATDMDALRSTPTNLNFEIDDLSNRIQDLFELRRMSVESLLTLMFSKRAKLFELRDKHMIFSTQELIKALDQEIMNVSIIKL